ncbi:MAG: N-acetyltransferase [Rhodobacteraceae bacterium]|nr:MAG: N-acetyltransferase [Paracoccaceae bacterium]
MTDDQALAFLLAMSEMPLLTPGEWTQIAIADPDGTLIGDMGLRQSEDGATVELGITLSRARQGQGLATDAMRQAIALIWDATGPQAIRTWADVRNTRSVALCHRLGLTHLGTETNGGVTEEAFILHRPGLG